MSDLALKASCKLIVCPQIENRNDRWIQVGVGAGLGAPSFTLTLGGEACTASVSLEKPGLVRAEGGGWVGGEAQVASETLPHCLCHSRLPRFPQMLGSHTEASPSWGPGKPHLHPWPLHPQCLGKIRGTALGQVWRGDHRVRKTTPGAPL